MLVSLTTGVCKVLLHGSVAVESVVKAVAEVGAMAALGGVAGRD